MPDALVNNFNRVNGQYADPYRFGGVGYNTDAIGRMWNDISGATANNAFSAEQAQISRDFSLYTSNTAYQRAVADMKAAGLNPAALGGQSSGVNPASSATSAGSASASGSGSGGLPGLLLGAFSKMMAQGFAASIHSAGREAVADGRNALYAMEMKAKDELNSARVAREQSSSRLNKARSAWSEYTLERAKSASDRHYYVPKEKDFDPNSDKSLEELMEELSKYEKS